MAGTTSADGNVPSPEEGVLSLGERAELEALRHEITEMRGQPVRRRRRSGWRAPVASLLIVLGCFLAPISVLGIRTANQISDTSRYVTTMAPLIQNPAIQNALSDKITNKIVAQINVPALASQTAAQLNQRGLPRIAALLQNFSGSIALLIVRVAYLNAVPSATLPSDAAAAAFDILVRFIRVALRTLLVIGLVVAAGAFLTGPSVTAVRIRSRFSAGFGWIRRRVENFGVSTGPVVLWTYGHRHGLRIGAVALAAVIFVFWGSLTVGVMIGIVVLLLVALGLIEVIGRPPAPATPPAPAAS
jgi:hypothetical protein